MLTALGCLRPATWTSAFKKSFYSIYRWIVFGLIQSEMAMLILDIIYNVETQDDLSDNFYLTMSLLGCNCKLFNFMIYRDQIMILISTLQKEPFLPKNAAEVDIKMKYDKIIEYVYPSLLAVVSVA